MRSIRSNRNQCGQSLLEAIIGIAILVAGVVTSLALGILTIRAGQVSERRTVADNLAREGLERVRNIRDSNWLADRGWDEGVCDPGGDETAILAFDPAMFLWSLDRSVNALSDDGAVVYEYEDSGRLLAYYFQATSGVPDAAEPTLFRRLLTLTPDVACIAGSVPTVYLVTSVVEWVENGLTHRSELTEQLYNWRP